MQNELKTLPNKRGYLHSNFLFFHLQDCRDEQFEFHYHDFYKIVVFITGRVTYLIEGKAYQLKSWDILLITNKDIHKAIIETSKIYDRIILWVDPQFLEKNSTTDSNLLTCFDKGSKEKSNLIRLDPEELEYIKYNLFELEKVFQDNSFGTAIIKNSLLLLLIVHFNRVCLQTKYALRPNNTLYNETISRIINYINNNLSNDLTIETLSAKFYLSRYTLMHKFKKQTGYTIHSFILQKRLILAGVQLKRGSSVMETSVECGFMDYSSFIRAFKKFYGMSPRQYSKTNGL